MYAAAASGDGKLIAAGGQDGVVRVWDAKGARRRGRSRSDCRAGARPPQARDRRKPLVAVHCVYATAGRKPRHSSIAATPGFVLLLALTSKAPPARACNRARPSRSDKPRPAHPPAPGESRRTSPRVRAVQTVVDPENQLLRAELHAAGQRLLLEASGDFQRVAESARIRSRRSPLSGCLRM